MAGEWSLTIRSISGHKTGTKMSRRKYRPSRTRWCKCAGGEPGMVYGRRCQPETAAMLRNYRIRFTMAIYLTSNNIFDVFWLRRNGSYSLSARYPESPSQYSSSQTYPVPLADLIVTTRLFSSNIKGQVEEIAVSSVFIDNATNRLFSLRKSSYNVYV